MIDIVAIRTPAPLSKSGGLMADRVVVLRGEWDSDTNRRSASLVFNGPQCDVTYRDNDHRPVHRREMPSVEASLHIAWLEK